MMTNKIEAGRCLVQKAFTLIARPSASASVVVRSHLQKFFVISEEPDQCSCHVVPGILFGEIVRRQSEVKVKQAYVSPPLMKHIPHLSWDTSYCVERHHDVVHCLGFFVIPIFYVAKLRWVAIDILGGISLDFVAIPEGQFCITFWHGKKHYNSYHSIFNELKQLRLPKHNLCKESIWGGVYV